MKKKSSFLLVFLIAFAVDSGIFAQNNNSAKSAVPRLNESVDTFNPLGQNPELDAVKQIAKEQIHLYLDDIPAGSLSQYGFKDKEDLKRISFDVPIRVYTLKNSDIVFTSSWRVPVVVDHEYRALLTIVSNNGIYKAVDFGAGVLARELQAKKINQSSGLLRVFEIKSDYVMEGTLKNLLKFVPVRATQDNSYKLGDIVNTIKEARL